MSASASAYKKRKRKVCITGKEREILWTLALLVPLIHFRIHAFNNYFNLDLLRTPEIQWNSKKAD